MTQEGLTDYLLSGEENVEHASESKSLPFIVFEMRAKKGGGGRGGKVKLYRTSLQYTYIRK